MGRGKLFSPWPSVVRNCYGLEVKVDNAAAECNREPAVCTESLNCSEEQEWIWRSQKAVPMDQEALSRVYCHPKALYQAWKQASACKGVGHCKGKTPGMSTSKLWDSKSCHSVIKEKKKKKRLYSMKRNFKTFCFSTDILPFHLLFCFSFILTCTWFCDSSGGLFFDLESSF